MGIIRIIKSKKRLFQYRNNWRKVNTHNRVEMNLICPEHTVFVGNATYGIINVHASNNSNKLVIGNYCSLANGITFILSSEHSLHSLPTFPYKTHILGSKYEGISKGDIIVEDDVWIGYGAIILF